MKLVEIFRRHFEEFIYPSPPNHFEPWRTAWLSTRGLAYDGVLVICKVIVVLTAGYGINILIRKRRPGGRNVFTSIVQHPVSIFILRFWLPLRLLCPSLLFELGVHLRTATDKLPRSINRAITTGLTKTAVYLEWMELIVIASLLYCLFEGPITRVVLLFVRWYAEYGTKTIRKRPRRNTAHSIIRVFEEEIVPAGQRDGAMTSNDEPGPSNESTVRRRLKTTRKRV